MCERRENNISYFYNFTQYCARADITQLLKSLVKGWATGVCSSVRYRSYLFAAESRLFLGSQSFLRALSSGVKRHEREANHSRG
jgi:hypothetical protein